MRDHRKEADTEEERAAARVREAYSPPRIVTSQAFERLALGCNGVPDEFDPIVKEGHTECTTFGSS